MMADQVSCATERWQLCVHLNIKSIKFSEEILRRKAILVHTSHQIKNHTEDHFFFFDRSIKHMIIST